MVFLGEGGFYSLWGDFGRVKIYKDISFDITKMVMKGCALEDCGNGE